MERKATTPKNEIEKLYRQYLSDLRISSLYYQIYKIYSTAVPQILCSEGDIKMIYSNEVEEGVAEKRKIIRSIIEMDYSELIASPDTS